MKKSLLLAAATLVAGTFVAPGIVCAQSINLRMVWTGDASGVWDYSGPSETGGVNWKCPDFSGPAYQFGDGDIVAFDATNARNNAVSVAAPVTVSGMEVLAGEYVFSGEKITSDANSAYGGYITGTGMLKISGDLTKVLFANEIAFDRGTEIRGKASAIFNKVTGAFYNEGGARAESITGNVINKGSLILAEFKKDENGNATGAIVTAGGNTVTSGDSGALTITTPGGGSSYGSIKLANICIGNKISGLPTGVLATVSGSISPDNGSGDLTLFDNSTITFSGTQASLSGGGKFDNWINVSLTNAGALTINNALNVIGTLSGTGTVAVMNNAEVGTLDGILSDYSDNEKIIPFNLKLENADGTFTEIKSGGVYDSATRTFTCSDGSKVSLNENPEPEPADEEPVLVQTFSSVRKFSLLGASAPAKGIVGDVVNDGLIIAGSIEGNVANNFTLIADKVTGSVVTATGSTTTVGEQIGDVMNAGTFNFMKVEGNFDNVAGGIVKLVGDEREALLYGNFSNAGTLDFVNAGRTLTVSGDFIGTGGTVRMDVDPSGATPSDKLVVAGNIAGTHHFNLTFTGDAATVTKNDTLTIIEAPGDIAGDETITGSVDVGLYTFWLTPDDAVAGNYVLATNAKAPFAPNVAGAVNAAGAMSLAWFSQLDNLSKRMGELRLANSACFGNMPAGEGDFWVRGYGQQSNVDLGIAGMGSFREYQYGADLGADKVWRLDEANAIYTGAFAGYQGATRRFNDNRGGAGSTDSVYGGVYGTWIHADGWYADGIVKGQYFDSESKAGGDTGDFTNYGVGVSLELGKQWTSANGWFVEPSAQFAYTHIFGDTYSTDAGLRVAAGDSDIYRFTGMIRAGKTCDLGSAGRLQPYVKVGAEEQISDGGAVRISAVGASERFEPSTDGTRVRYGAGIIWQLDAAQQIHLDYEGAFGDKYDTPWAVNAGYRVRF